MTQIDGVDKTPEQIAHEQLEETLTNLEKNKQENDKVLADLEKNKSENANYESQKDALSKENERILNDIKAAREERRKLSEKDKTFAEKFRDEQLEKAKQRFLKDFKYEDESAKEKLLETFKKLDGGSVDADNIYQDLVRTHLYLNPDKYIGIEKQMGAYKDAAFDNAAAQSSSGFNGGDANLNQGDIELTPDDIAAIQWAGMSTDTYKKLKAEGKI